MENNKKIIMRIISGKSRGALLYLPKNKTTRPLKDLVRESVFNFLTHSNKIFFEIKQSYVLDLYSGTGSFGLECLSRSSRKVFFVENEKNTIKILEKNIEKLKMKEKTKIFFSDVFDLIKKKNIFLSKFDLIFCDPPFEDKKILELIELIFKKNLLNKNGILILHRNKNTKNELPDYFKILDQRLYGKSKITFGKFLS